MSMGHFISETACYYQYTNLMNLVAGHDLPAYSFFSEHKTPLDMHSVNFLKTTRS